MRNNTFFLLLVLIVSGCGENNTRFVDYSKLHQAFDLCPYWRDQMTWDDIRAKRRLQENPGLIKYVDKIEQQKMAKDLGISVPTTYISTRNKTPIVATLSGLSSYVAKATHLSFSGGLIIVENGKNIFTDEPITPLEVQNQMYSVLDQQARDVESWAVHQVPPGFLIQEYIPDRNEIKVQTVWGRAVVGEWRSGGSQNKTSTIHGYFDREGNPISNTASVPKYWPDVIALAEKVSQNTDFLRVDFFIDTKTSPPRIMLNEMEIWPESFWIQAFDELASRLNQGYRGKCQPKS